MDAEIADLIEQNLEPWSNAWDAMDESKHLALDYYKDTAKMYCDSVTRFIVRGIPHFHILPLSTFNKSPHRIP